MSATKTTTVTPNMKAIILSGGFGTRLRPFTFTKPKPLVEFCNLPILYHQIEALAKIGVSTVILAVSYLEEQLEQAAPEIKAKYGVDIIISVEDEPMGTAGPIALAKKYLDDDKPFFVFNSDVTCSFPLEKLYNFHMAHGKEGTIMVTPVEEPSKYGVVLADSTGCIEQFVEKPQTYVGNCINAGLYILNPSILKRIPTRPTSIEKEIFPQMASEHQLYSLTLDGFWMDIGRPTDYLTGVDMTLAYYKESRPEKLTPGSGHLIVDESSTISDKAVLKNNVVIGRHCVVEEGVYLENCTLFDNTVVKKSATITNSIIGWNNIIHENAQLNYVFSGDDCRFVAGVQMDNYYISPHLTLRTSNPKVQNVLMN